MPSFDYISNAAFRESLERDYAELSSSVEHGNWKSAQVIAGSIVEALLIDYIAATPNPERSEKRDPLRLDLAQAIAVCVSEGVLTARTSDLCTVIKSFRNLIHPGRVVRDVEQAPNASSASIALHLVDLITEDVSKERQKRVGLTAEQLVKKLVNDHASHGLLQFLLAGFDENQRSRLLTDVLPAAYNALPPQDSAGIIGGRIPDPTPIRLRMVYREILEGASVATREKVASQFVTLLRNGSGADVRQHSLAFFYADDMQHVPDADKGLVKTHMLQRLPSSFSTPEEIGAYVGLAKYLEVGDVTPWVDTMVRTLSSLNLAMASTARNEILSAGPTTTFEFYMAVETRLSDWQSHWSGEGEEERARQVTDVKESLMPF